MADPIASQFGALEKLMKETAEADMRKQIALTRYKLGQTQAKIMAQQELEQGQAEMQAREQAQSQQPTAPFQIQLPNSSAMAERPVQWKNPLSQIAGNAFSQMAQAGAAGPGAAIQEALRNTAGAVPSAEQAMTQGLPMAGASQQATTTDFGLQAQPIGQQGFMMVPQYNQRTQETPNALTAQDQAGLRAQILDRLMQIQGAQQKSQGPQFDAGLFRQQLNDLDDNYGSKVPAELKSKLALAVAMGDSTTAAELSAKLPAPKAPYDPLERSVLTAKYKEAQEEFAGIDQQITGKKRVLSIFKDAERVLREAKAKTGLVAGSSLGQVIQRLGVIGDETSVNILQQAFGEQFLEAMQSADFKGSFSEKEGDRIEKTTGDLSKSLEFNQRDLRMRNAILEAQIKQNENIRKTTSGTLKAIEKKIGADEYLPPPVERVEPVLPEEEGPAVQGAAPDAGVEDLLKKYQ